MTEGADAVSTNEDALDTLKETSRTFFIPISRLPAGLLDAVMSGYLCLRAIDEVEDHPRLDNHTKAIDRKSTRLNSSHTVISYAVFCLKKKKYTTKTVRTM